MLNPDSYKIFNRKCLGCQRFFPKTKKKTIFNFSKRPCLNLSISVIKIFSFFANFDRTFYNLDLHLYFSPII